MCTVKIALKAWYVMWSDDFDMYIYDMYLKVELSIVKGLYINEVCIWNMNYDNV